MHQSLSLCTMNSSMQLSTSHFFVGPSLCLCHCELTIIVTWTVFKWVFNTVHCVSWWNVTSLAPLGHVHLPTTSACRPLSLADHFRFRSNIKEPLHAYCRKQQAMQGLRTLAPCGWRIPTSWAQDSTPRDRGRSGSGTLGISANHWRAFPSMHQQGMCTRYVLKAIHSDRGKATWRRILFWSYSIITFLGIAFFFAFGQCELPLMPLLVEMLENHLSSL